MLRIGWFSTGRDQAARDLLQIVWRKIDEGVIKAKIEFAFSNREPGESEESDLFFDLVKGYRLPLICLSSKRFRAEVETGADWRLQYEKEIMKRLQGFHADLFILAGYMLIVGEEMCRRYKMINLHPAAPGGPTGTWQEVIWKLIEDRAQETGVMMHLVIPELDKGPPVTYCSFPIRGEPFDKYWKEIEGKPLAEIKANQDEKNPLFEKIREHGLAREFPLIVATIKAFSEGRVRIEDGKVVSASDEVIKGYDLTEEINSELHLL